MVASRRYVADGTATFFHYKSAWISVKDVLQVSAGALGQVSISRYLCSLSGQIWQDILRKMDTSPAVPPFLFCFCKGNPQSWAPVTQGAWIYVFIMSCHPFYTVRQVQEKNKNTHARYWNHCCGKAVACSTSWLFRRSQCCSLSCVLLHHDLVSEIKFMCHCLIISLLPFVFQFLSWT